MPLSDDSLKILESVKKTGKPCKFVMVAKAAKPISIVAFRKGSEQSYVKEAKEAGTGTVVCGVVDTAPIEVQGANLSFKLQRTECDSPPVARSRLKDFLNEGAKSQWANPAIDIVDALPTVEMEGQGQEGQTQQGQQGQGQQPVKYRTGDEWKVVLAAVQKAKGDQARELVYQAFQEWKAENERNKQTLQTNANSQPDLDQQVILGKVEKILLTLGQNIKAATQQQTETQPQPTVQTPPPTNTNQPNTTNQPTTTTTPPRPQQPPPPLPMSQSGRRRKEHIDSAKPLRDLAIKASKSVLDAQEKGFPEVDLAALAQEGKDAAEKTRIGVHKDKILPTIYDLMSQAKDLATHGQLAEAHHRLVEAQQLWTTGREAQVKERKSSVLDATKKILDERLTQYDKIATTLNSAAQKIGAAASELTHVGNELCKAVRTMLGEHQTGKPDAINPQTVGSLEEILKLPGLPDTIAAVGKKLATDARAALKKQYDAKQGNVNTRQAKAELMLEWVPSKFSDGGTSGTSEVQLVRSFDKSVTFAFKPLDGESSQNEGDTLREVLTSSMCQKFKELTNLDLGFPEVSVANIGGRSGALIEGLTGHELPVEKSGHLKDTDKAQLNQMAKDLPPKELQKVFLSAIVSGDGDLKWDNVFIGTDGSSARRFDGGKGFPDDKGRAEIFLGEVTLNTKIPSTKNCALLCSPFVDSQDGSKSTLPGAKVPISPDLVRDFLKIKEHLDELKTSMKQQSQTVCQSLSTSDKPQQFDPKTIDQTAKSIEAAIRILEANPQITTEQFYTAHMTQRVLDMAADYLSDQQAEINQYDATRVQPRLQALKLTLNPDLTIPVAKIQAIIQGGVQNYDEERDSQVLHNEFLVINQLLAAMAYAAVDPQTLDVAEWKKSAKVTGPEPLNTPALVDLYWDALGRLTKPELVKLLEKLAFGRGDGKIGLPGEYPDVVYDKATADKEPRAFFPSGRLKVSIPCDKKTIVKTPTADEIATMIRAVLK